jgi:hypothetical protein
MIIPEGEEGRRLASCTMIQGRYLYEEKEGYKKLKKAYAPGLNLPFFRRWDQVLAPSKRMGWGMSRASLASPNGYEEQKRGTVAPVR